MYLCYGRMSNRDSLKRYGFCLSSNKYNHMYIKLRLEQNDEEFPYRQYIIQKFFSVDKQNKAEKDSFQVIEPSDQSLDVQSRHFKIYYQKLNTSKSRLPSNSDIRGAQVHQNPDFQCQRRRPGLHCRE